MDLKKINIILLSSLFIASCGGGGGGGGSSSAASPVSYSYDKTTADYTNKTWQADAVTRRIRPAESWDYFATYGSDPDGPIQIDFVENADYLTINLQHKLASFDITLSEIDSSIDPLYDPSGNIVAALAQNDYVDATLYALFFFPEYLSTLNIEHTNVGFLDLYFGGGDRDTFAINYGSKTYTGDMPTSGSATYEIFTEAAYTEYYNENSSSRFLARGEGSLSANFSNNKISGSINLSSFYNYNQFLIYGATSESQILNVPTFNINFPEASISGNSFEYGDGNPLSLTVSEFGISGDGIAGGSFFGPDGKEVSGTFLGTQDDNDNSGLFDWDIIGVFYGTCKPSGC